MKKLDPKLWNFNLNQKILNDEIFDEGQNEPLTLFSVSFWLKASFAHELSCFHRFAPVIG